MKRWEAAFRLLGVGWYIGVCIVLGAAGGIWLDKKFNNPLFIVVGLIAGVFIAFYGVYRMILPNMNKNIGKNQNKGKN